MEIQLSHESSDKDQGPSNPTRARKMSFSETRYRDQLARKQQEMRSRNHVNGQEMKPKDLMKHDKANGEVRIDRVGKYLALFKQYRNGNEGKSGIEALIQQLKGGEGQEFEQKYLLLIEEFRPLFLSDPDQIADKARNPLKADSKKTFMGTMTRDKYELVLRKAVYKMGRLYIEVLQKLSNEETEQLSEREKGREVNIEQYFRDQFVSILKRRDLSAPQSDMLSSIDRHMEVNDVEKKYGEAYAKAFAIARGKTILEKSKQTPYQNSTPNFVKRYDQKTSDDGRVAHAETSMKNGDMAYYEHILRLGEGLINVIDIDNKADKKEIIEGTYPLPYSEVLWNVCKSVISEIKKKPIEELAISDEKEINIKKVVFLDAIEKETLATGNIFLRGRNLQDNRFEEGSDAYYAMLGTPLCSGIVYLLEQHRNALGERKITEIQFASKISMLIEKSTEIVES